MAAGRKLQSCIFFNQTLTYFNLCCCSVTLDTIQDVVRSHDVGKVKSLLRNNQLPVDHEARTRLWALLCVGTVEEIEDATFQSYASKFANGKWIDSQGGLRLLDLLSCRQFMYGYLLAVLFKGEGQ